MSWCKLVELEAEEIWRGALLRMPGEYPYEDIVDFLVIDLEGALALLVASGYKAGLVRQVLPTAAYVAPNVHALSRAWLIEHWEQWVDVGSVADVWIRAENPAPAALPQADPQ